MLRITQLDSCEDNLLNLAGDIYLRSAGDKLPESTGDKLPKSIGDKLPKSTGEDDSTLLGKLWTALGSGSTRVSCIPPGNNLILRLPGMLAEEHLYTPLGNIEIFW